MNYGKFVFLKTYLPRTAFEDSSSGIYMNIYLTKQQVFFNSILNYFIIFLWLIYYNKEILAFHK